MRAKQRQETLKRKDIEMGLFGKIFGKEEKKESCCCEMEIVELPEGDIAAPVSYTHLTLPTTSRV